MGRTKDHAANCLHVAFLRCLIAPITVIAATVCYLVATTMQFSYLTVLCEGAYQL